MVKMQKELLGFEIDTGKRVDIGNENNRTGNRATL